MRTKQLQRFLSNIKIVWRLLNEEPEADRPVSVNFIKEYTGIHKEVIKVILNFLVDDMGKVGRVLNGTSYKYYSKTKLTPNIRKRRKIPITNEMIEEDIEKLI